MFILVLYFNLHYNSVALLYILLFVDIMFMNYTKVYRIPYDWWPLPKFNKCVPFVICVTNRTQIREKLYTSKKDRLLFISIRLLKAIHMRPILWQRNLQPLGFHAPSINHCDNLQISTNSNFIPELTVYLPKGTLYM